MSIVTKGDIANGALKWLRISGITAGPEAEDISAMLDIMDDKAGELLASGLDINWQQPATYGQSGPLDNSGLNIKTAGPVKKLMALEVAPLYGKEAPPTLGIIYRQGMAALRRALVNVAPSELSSVIPVGSGNESTGYNRRHFYPEPAENTGVITVQAGDILTYSEPGFGDWLVDATLDQVTWVVGAGVDASNIITGGRTTMADLTFSASGGHSITITATKTGSSERKTLVRNFIVNPSPITGYAV